MQARARGARARAVVPVAALRRAATALAASWRAARRLECERAAVAIQRVAVWFVWQLAEAREQRSAAKLQSLARGHRDRAATGTSGLAERARGRQDQVVAERRAAAGLAVAEQRSAAKLQALTRGRRDRRFAAAAAALGSGAAARVVQRAWRRCRLRLALRVDHAARVLQAFFLRHVWTDEEH